MRLLSALAPMAFAAVLAACAPEPGLGSCEPGVEDLSRTATVCP